MFKISITDTPCERRLLVEGKLIPPWTVELQRVWRDANHGLDGRRLAIDLSEVTMINPEGEDTLFDLMKAGAKFTCGGVLTKDVLKRLARDERARGGMGGRGKARARGRPPVGARRAGQGSPRQRLGLRGQRARRGASRMTSRRA